MSEPVHTFAADPDNEFDKPTDMKLTIELTEKEYNVVSEALRLAAGNRIPNDLQRLELWKLNDRLTDAKRKDEA